MKKILFLAGLLAVMALMPAHAITVTKTWVLVLSAGETAIITPEDGEVKLLMSAGIPATTSYIGLLLKKSGNDFIMFEAAPADVWARAYKIDDVVNLTVNRTTDVNAQ